MKTIQEIQDQLAADMHTLNEITERWRSERRQGVELVLDAMREKGVDELSVAVTNRNLIGDLRGLDTWAESAARSARYLMDSIDGALRLIRTAERGERAR